MKWIGQHIWNLTSRFRDDVYFEGLAETEETRGLVVDANGKVSINPLSGDEHATHIYENVRNDEGSTIPVGTPVYSKGEIGGSERIKVGVADASDPAKMPAIGITNTELTTTGDTKDGLITLVGVYNTNISDPNFVGLNVNDIVYVAPGGRLTTTKPTGTNLIQNIGIILKTNGNTIQGLQVTCIGRTNDVPTPLYIDHANQRVGIGATSPAYKLDVAGSVAADTFVSIQGVDTGNPSADIDELRVSGYGVLGRRNSGVYLTNEASGPLYFGTGGRHAVSTRMTIDSSGNVGIGTASPTSKLHVIGDTRIEGDLTVNGTYTQIDTDVLTTEQWLVTNDGTGPAAVINQLGTEDIFDVQDDGASVFYIEDGGNIGIGTTSPEAKLTIKGDALYTNQPVRITNSVTDTHTGLFLNNTGATVGEKYGMQFGGYNQYSIGGIFGVLDSTSGSTSGDITFDMCDGTSAGSLIERMRITHEGNVGIGTTSPGYKLDVNGSVNTAFGATNGYRINTNRVLSQLSGGVEIGVLDYKTIYPNISFNNDNTFRVQQNGSTKVIVNSSGNVGIGTTSPGYKLEVNGTGSFFGNIRSGGGTLWSDSNGGVQLGYSSSDATGYLTTYYDSTSVVIGAGISQKTGITINGQSASAGNQITFRVGNAERMRITDTGNVGIGTTSPSSKLHVAGEITADDQINFNNFGGSLLKITKPSWTSVPTQDLIYQSWDTTIDDYIYLKAPGNTTTTHGIALIGDGVIAFGRTNNETGAPELTSAAAPLNDNWLVLNSTSATFGGNLTSSGYVKLGADEQILSDGSITIDIDYNNNQTDRVFSVRKDNTTELFRVQENGNVGIGTTSPNYFLDVEKSGANARIFNTAASTELFLQCASGYVSSINFGDTSDNNAGRIIYREYDHAMTFTTNTSEAMFIDSSQRVGIGTSSPGYKLHVNGGGLQTTTATGNRIAYYDGSGINAYGGTSGYAISNYTGDLNIRQHTNDGDIIFQCDDGSGGLATYFFLDGSNGWTTFPDNKKTAFGTGNDLQIYHDGSNSYLRNTNGNLYIKNELDDGDIIFQSDDGSGGVEAYFKLDGDLGINRIYKALRADDNVQLQFGSGADLRIFHDSFSSYISQQGTGHLTIRNTTDDADIVFQSDDGSGGTETYFYLDGSVGMTVFPDAKKLSFGNSFDLKLEHDGSNSYLSHEGTGNLIVRNTTDDGDIIFQSDNGSGGVSTYFFLDGSNSHTNFQLNARWVDDAQAQFGNSGDLLVYHDGSNSYIDDTGTGHLNIRATNLQLLNAAGNKYYASFADGGDAKLFYNGSEKLATTSTGVEVTGNISLSGSVQRQISTTHHTFTFGAAGSASQDYWVPFIGSSELAAPNVTHRTVAPYTGILKKAIVHSTVAYGTSAQVRFHRIDNGTTSVFVNDNSTDDVTTNVTADMSTAYSSVAFDFTTGNAFSAGDQIGVSFVRDNTGLGDVAITLVWEYELF